MGLAVFLGFSIFCLLVSSVPSVSAHPLQRRLVVKKAHESAIRMVTGGGSSVSVDPTRVTQLSWNPRAFLYWGFLSEEECDHLISLANDRMEKSMVADNDPGKSIQSEVESSVKPKKGDALLFFSLHPDATTDTSSLHGSCPVIEGDKWSATKWIHIRKFDMPARSLTDGECKDENVNCGTWAKARECEKNPAYMVGSEDANGYCRKSCKVCS